MTTKPEMLNALHACRNGHPLNNTHAWRNAYVMACLQPSYVFDSKVIVWLREQASAESIIHGTV